MHRRLWWIEAVLFLSLNAYGQADRGSLAGTLKDSSGGVSPGASVTVFRDDRGLTRTTVSSSTGAYSIPELPVSMYTATLALKGFQTAKFGTWKSRSSTRPPWMNYCRPHFVDDKLRGNGEAARFSEEISGYFCSLKCESN
jgi:hypothetical protein